jgi:hypothetical protein
VAVVAVAGTIFAPFNVALTLNTLADAEKRLRERSRKRNVFFIWFFGNILMQFNGLLLNNQHIKICASRYCSIVFPSDFPI